MLGDISAVDNIYIITGYTDMRKSIDGLCAIILEQMKADLDSHAIYLFFGKTLRPYQNPAAGAGRICHALQAFGCSPGKIPLATEQSRSKTLL